MEREGTSQEPLSRDMNDRKKPVIRNFGVREFKMEDELVQRLKGGRDGVFKEQEEKQCD